MDLKNKLKGCIPIITSYLQRLNSDGHLGSKVCWIQLDNCKVVFDVTQISYRSSDKVYQAFQSITEEVQSLESSEGKCSSLQCLPS